MACRGGSAGRWVSITLNYGKALKAEIRIEGDYPVYGSSGIVGTMKKPGYRAGDHSGTQGECR
jgi:hypothetical protein